MSFPAAPRALVVALFLSLLWLSADCAKAAVWISPAGGYWSDSNKWSSGSVPGFADNVDIGSSAAAKNSTVRLDQPAFADVLATTDGMGVRNWDNVTGDVMPLTVAGKTTLKGENLDGFFLHRAAIVLRRGTASYDFSTNDLDVEEGGRLHLQDDAIAIVQGLLTTLGPDNDDGAGRITGSGVVNLTSNGNTLSNNGLLSPQGHLTLNQTSGGLFDLDGSAEENGQIWVRAFGQGDELDHLTLNGSGLTDSFSGQILLTDGRRLDANLSNGWAIDASGEIEVAPDSFPSGSAYIAGGDLEFGGALRLNDAAPGQSVRLRIESNTTITPTASVQVGSKGELQFEDVTVFGGQYSVGQDARIAFYGDTTVAGGEFTTPTDSSPDGNVIFNGDTVYRGAVTFNGIATQVGDVTVTQPAVINADRFHMQASPVQEWNINSLLTINAESIDTVPENIFAGTANVAGNFLGRLTINLADPNDRWRMDGTLNLHNDLPFGAERLAGSHVVIGHELNVDGTGIRVAADATFAPTSGTTFATGDSSLVMRRVTRVEAGATFVGDGLLNNHATGHLTLDDGVGTDDVGVRNSGLLDIDDAAGIVTVDRFENTADGTLAIDVGGHLLGDEFDHLHVAGETMLDGILAVDLLLDEFAFLPEIGDEFMILTSLGGVSGEFAEVLPTLAGDQVFGWEVLYHLHDVTIRLADISAAVPEPNAFVLLGFGTVGVLSSRRGRAA